MVVHKFKQSLQSRTILDKTWKHLKTLALTQLALAVDGESSALLGGVIFKFPATTAQASIRAPCNFTMFHKRATEQRSPGKTARRHAEPPVAKPCPCYAFHIGSDWHLLKGKDRVRGGKCVIHLVLSSLRTVFNQGSRTSQGHLRLLIWFKIEIWAWPASSSNFAESWKNGTNVGLEPLYL